jgi:hypothetical protein
MIRATTVLRGRLRGRRIDLEEDVDVLDGEVEVILKPASTHSEGAPCPTVSDWLGSLAHREPGTRSKGDIDRQLEADRDEWQGDA